MSRRYANPVLSTVAFAAIAVAAVPADPTITAPAILPRQNDAQFIGWVEYSGSCKSRLSVDDKYDIDRLYRVL